MLLLLGTSVDWEVSLQVGSAGPTHAMPAGWYVEDPRDSVLLSNLPINGLDEWDVSKLGWFKSRSPLENHMDATGEQIIRSAFKVNVENCALNSYKYQVYLVNSVGFFRQIKVVFYFAVFSRVHGPQSIGEREKSRYSLSFH